MSSRATSLCFAIVCLLLAVPTARSQQGQLDGLVDREMPSLLSTYKSLHAAPELSHHEEKTSAFVAGQLRSLGYTVTDHIGKYAGHPEWVGYGVVGVLKNGAGPTVYVRTELDALPVEEITGLPYASKVRTKDDSGREVGVMHACGHDIHMTSFLGTAKLLAELKDQWQGTLVVLAQPAEEAISGAKSMLDDGLYTRFPRPDYVLALHDSPGLEAGKVGYTPGYAMANSTAVDVILRGIGGHGSAPQAAKDPIVEAAQFILAIQTIVSRENSPFDPAVVTVGSIHGGTRYNIIPDEVRLQLTIRTYKEEVRQHILASLQRIAQGIATADGIPASLAPSVIASDSEYTPAMYNDPPLTLRLAEVFKRALGADNVAEMPAVMASEDFGRFGLENRQIPICQFSLGAVDGAKLVESRRTGVPLPGLHSNLWAPVPEPTLRTGVKSMTSAVLDLMKK
ncbi:MAG: amidohydrolase [Acidobacteriota bacterium]|nr:amidohydrolase [Acidobacteriota bacterium]